MPFDFDFIHLKEIDSTNNFALNYITKTNPKEGFCIFTDYQTAGKGQYGRNWVSDSCQNILCSIILKPTHLSIDRLFELHIISSLAIFKTLYDLSIKELKIKWPNDIYQANSKLKISGILVENIFRDQINHSVIGIGIDNLANWERNQLLVDLVASLDHLINEFKLFGFALLRREWLDNCLHLKHNVKILQHGAIIARGIHSDIGEHGELIVQTATGIQNFSSSAISLRLD